MAFLEYNPFSKDIRIKYECPHCGSVETTDKIRVPKPNFEVESHSSSITSDSCEIECGNCKELFDLTLATGISGGEGILNGVKSVLEVYEFDDADKVDDSFGDDSDDISVPPSDIIAFNELRSCADINRMYVKGQLDINPDFQRGEVWHNRAQTLFVDSLIKQLPIPSLCISLDVNTQKRLVIDGLQRIITITKFLDKNSVWRLSKLDEVDDRISGKRVDEIKTKSIELYDILENVTIPITVLRCDYRKNDHMKYLFQIFHRLNSGGNKLYNQEIRNCIFQGSFNTLLKELARSQEWLSFTGVTSDKVERSRFGHEERILRFFAFNDRFERYAGKFASFLNEYMNEKKDIVHQEIVEYKKLFTTVLSVANRLSVKPDSKNVSDALLVGIARNIDKLKDCNQETLDSIYRQILSSEEFSYDEIREGLGIREKVISRIKKSIGLFANA